MKKHNKRPFFRLIKFIVRIFMKKPKIINVENVLDEPCVYISNHAASSGPANFELYLPTNFQMMGAHQMCGTLKERWNYLYMIYFHQKRKLPKWLAGIIATIIIPFMIGFYKGMQIIPIYYDIRLKKTIDYAVKTLEKNISILIFPEDSFDGYHDELKSFFGGFWLIAKEYQKRTGKDIKIVNMYFHKKDKIIYVDEPKSYLELSKELINHKEAATYFLNNTNRLYKLIQEKHNK